MVQGIAGSVLLWGSFTSASFGPASAYSEWYESKECNQTKTFWYRWSLQSVFMIWVNIFMQVFHERINNTHNIINYYQKKQSRYSIIAMVCSCPLPLVKHHTQQMTMNNTHTHTRTHHHTHTQRDCYLLPTNPPHIRRNAHPAAVPELDTTCIHTHTHVVRSSSYTHTRSKSVTKEDVWPCRNLMRVLALLIYFVVYTR